MLIKKLSGLLSKDLAIDLGTANTLVALRGRGVVIREPSVVSLVKGSDRVLAVGDEAKRMLGRAPGTIEVIRPLRSGVIADFDCTMAMLRYFITKVHRRQRLVRPRIIIQRAGKRLKSIQVPAFQVCEQELSFFFARALRMILRRWRAST